MVATLFLLGVVVATVLIVAALLLAIVEDVEEPSLLRFDAGNGGRDDKDSEGVMTFVGLVGVILLEGMVIVVAAVCGSVFYCWCLLLVAYRMLLPGLHFSFTTTTYLYSLALLVATRVVVVHKS